MPQYTDSVDKIMLSYVASCASSPFYYKGVLVEPSKKLQISPKLMREFTCPSGCGACCPRFSLDYLPSEREAIDALKLTPRQIRINDKNYTVFSDLQEENKDYHCKYLEKITGRCKIHDLRPFSCDFEILRFLHNKERAILMTRTFGRAWNMLQCDGKTRGCKCIIRDYCSPQESLDIRRKLKRLLDWLNYFGFEENKLKDMQILQGGYGW